MLYVTIEKLLAIPFDSVPTTIFMEIYPKFLRRSCRAIIVKYSRFFNIAVHAYRCIFKDGPRLDNFFFTYLQHARHFIIRSLFYREAESYVIRTERNISSEHWCRRSKSGTPCTARIPRPAESYPLIIHLRTVNHTDEI